MRKRMHASMEEIGQQQFGEQTQTETLIVTNIHTKSGIQNKAGGPNWGRKGLQEKTAPTKTHRMVKAKEEAKRGAKVSVIGWSFWGGRALVFVWFWGAPI